MLLKSFFQVCELHFQSGDIKNETSHYDKKTGNLLTAKLKHPSLREDAIPRILPNCPAYLSSTVPIRESPDSKRIRQENSALKSALAQSIADEIANKKKREFDNIDDLEGKLHFLDTQYWSIIRQQGSLLICRVLKLPFPKISVSLLIEPDCSVHVFCSDVKMRSIGDYKIPSHINDINLLEDLLVKIRNLDIQEYDSQQKTVTAILRLIISFLALLQDQSYEYFPALKFIQEQLHLMTLKKFVYSTEMMIFSSLLSNCSPCGYRMLRDSKNLILPSYSTIRRLTLSMNMNPVVEQHKTNFLMYIRNKFRLISQKDITVSLLVDEIHLKPYFDYKGGNVVGLAYNGSDAATSAFAFMLSSVCSKFKDVVHVMPTKCIKAEALFDVIKKIIVGLEDIGFKVISVITDNNAINKKAMSFFSNPPKLSVVYMHPVKSSRPLFFLFDSVHLLKCIRNNWLNQKDSNKYMMFPKFCKNGNHDSQNISKAPFTTLQKLHSLESHSLLKYAYKLTAKALSPSSLERQNVTFVLQIFNEYLIQALLSLGAQECLPNFDEVAEYIDIFHTWWTIVNVKTPFKGHRFNNKRAYPLTNDLSDENYVFLNVFCDWLECWNSIPGNIGKLTKETYTALHHTTHAMIELTNYCIEELKMQYILPGKFQTDDLEARFGQYRQLSGGQYNISVRQVFECEKKIRMMSYLQLCKSFDTKFFLEEPNWDEMAGQQGLNIYKFDVDVSDKDIKECKKVIPIIYYLAGYCCYAVFKKNKCTSCKALITGAGSEIPEINSYFQGINRGSLLQPNDITANFILYNYVVINKLTKDASFLRVENHRKIAMHITLDILAESDFLFHIDTCDEGHNMEKIEKMLLWSSTNSLLNNFCNKENDSITNKKTLNKRRKLQIFS